jgi:hypothetical protein
MKELIIAINKNQKVHELFRFQLKDNQTVYYSRLYPSLNLPSVHTTWHDKNIYNKNPIVQVKGSKKNNLYLKEILNKGSETVFMYPFEMMDLHKINWTTVKEVKSKKVEVVIIPNPFPEYITAYFFQGNKTYLPGIIEKFINSKNAIAFFPFYDGVYSGPKGHPMKCFTFIYEFNLDTSIGGIILGAQPPKEGYNPKISKPINKGNLVAFAPGKEKIINY